MVTLPDGANVGDGGHVTDHNLIVAALTTHDTQIASVQAQANTSTSKVAALETTVNTTHPARMTAIESTNTTQQTAIDANAAGLAQVGNLLTANQASFESGTTGWTGNNATLAQDTGGLVGTYCLKATYTATSSGSGAYTSSIAVTPGQTYTGVASVKYAGIIYARIQWLTSGGSPISLVDGEKPTATTAAWTTLTVTGVAPPTAASARLVVANQTSAAAGDPLWIDKAGLWQGAGGDWALPGTPIANTGRRVTHPNTDDTLVQIWDGEKGRWQTTHYDSGWRKIAIWDAAGNWTEGTKPDTTTFEHIGAGYWLARRIGNRVRLVLSASIKMAAGSSPGSTGVLVHLPAQFAPAMQQSLTPFNGFNVQAANTQIGRAGNTNLPIAGNFLPNAVAWEYTCGDTIPTSLPGVNHVSAPALLQSEESVDQGTFVSPDSDPKPDVFAHHDDGTTTPIDPPLGE